MPELGVKSFGGDCPTCSTQCSCPVSHGPPPSPVRTCPFLLHRFLAHPLTWATWHQGCPSQLYHNTHLETLDDVTSFSVSVLWSPK